MAAVLSHDAYYGHGRAIRLDGRNFKLRHYRRARSLDADSTHTDIPSPPPIALTDEQLDAIVRASQPFAPIDRGKFLEAVAEGLRCRVVGDGAVHLAICEAQRQLWRPPEVERATGTSKWR
jgi:hypothetical protein